MSTVTNIVMQTDISSDCEEVIQGMLRKHTGSELAKLPDHYNCGGSKYMEIDVYVGAFNNLPTACIQEIKETVKLNPVFAEESFVLTFTYQNGDVDIVARGLEWSIN